MLEFYGRGLNLVIWLFFITISVLYSTLTTNFIIKNAPVRVNEGMAYFGVLALVFAIAVCFILPAVGGLEETNIMAYFVSSSLGFGALLIAPSRPLLQKLLFVFIGLGILIGLNELSKLGLDVRAPSVPGP